MDTKERNNVAMPSMIEADKENVNKNDEKEK